MLYQQGAHNGSNMGTRMHSYPMYQDFQKRAEPLAELLCRRLVAASVSIDNQTERLEAEIVSGNYFTMLGVKPAVGRLFNSQEDDQVYQGHPVVVLSYTYWNNRFARDPGVVGKKILVNDFPMTIIGVSAAGFAGIDPARSPQIRVPVLMKETMLPEWPWLHVDNRRARWVQVFGRLKPGYTVESAAAPLQGLFTQIRTYEMTLPAAKDWSAVLARPVHEGAHARGERSDGLLGDPQRFLDGAHRADVHGRPGAADRLRQRRQPADRPRIHAPEGNRRAPLARRVARTARAPAAGRESRPLGSRRRRRTGPGVPAHARAAAAGAHRRPAADDQRVSRRAHPDVHRRADVPDRDRLRAASRASRQPAGSLDDVEGHGRLDRRHRRVALPAQGPRHCAGGAQLPPAVRRRPVREEPPEPARRPKRASSWTTW